MSQTLFRYIGMLCNPRYGTVGLIAMPYLFFIEFLSPVVEMLGYVIFTAGLISGTVSLFSFTIFLALAVFIGMVLSLLALLTEEVVFHRYQRFRDLLWLMFIAVLENFGYRQYMTFVRFKGIIDWLRGRKAWGTMKRRGLS